MKLFSIFLACCLLTSPVLAQKDGGPNLVLNPSFETLKDKETNVKTMSEIDLLTGWSAPNSSSPKVYTTTKGAIYDEYGSSWKFKARTGKNVAGMRVYGGYAGKENRDYIQG